MRKRLTIILGFVALILAACDKDDTLLEQADCEMLKGAIHSGDVHAAKIQIEKFINSLPSKTYNEENINLLINAIQDQCGFYSTYDCFDCIHTLPSMTEILVGYSNNGLMITKIIDLSYNSENKIVFVNMH